MFDTYIINPLVWLLSYLSQYTDSLVLSITILTLGIRFLLYPLTKSSIKSAGVMRDLQPQLEQLKKDFAEDKVGLQQAQLALFQKHNINPLSGCLPQVLQLGVLIALYQVFMVVLKPGSTGFGSTHFLWLDVTKPDPYYLLPVLAGVTQLIMGLMLLPATSTAAEKTLSLATKTKTDDAAAEDFSSMAATVQQQMVYLAPFMTAFVALNFPSGLAYYWILSTVLSIIQQYFLSGLGGLKNLKLRKK